MKRFRPTVRIRALRKFDDVYEEYAERNGVETRVFLNRLSMIPEEGVRSLDLRHAEKLIAAKKVEYADSKEKIILPKGHVVVNTVASTQKEV